MGGEVTGSIWLSNISFNGKHMDTHTPFLFGEHCGDFLGPVGPGMERSKQTAEYITAKSLQSCLTLCNPIDGSLPGSAVPGLAGLDWVSVKPGVATPKGKSGGPGPHS